MHVFYATSGISTDVRQFWLSRDSFLSNHGGEKYLMDYNYLFPREGFQPFQTIILRRDFY